MHKKQNFRLGYKHPYFCVLTGKKKDKCFLFEEFERNIDLR